jgi:hypothetical protein
MPSTIIDFERIEIVHHTMTDLQVLAAWVARSFSRKVASSMRDCVEQKLRGRAACIVGRGDKEEACLIPNIILSFLSY